MAVGGTLVGVAVGGMGVLVAVGGTLVEVAVGSTGVLVAVGGTLVGVAVAGTGVFVAVGGRLVGVAVGLPLPHDGNLKEPIRVLHGAVPVVWIYSVVNQKVQSSTGSTAIMA